MNDSSSHVQARKILWWLVMALSLVAAGCVFLWWRGPARRMPAPGWQHVPTTQPPHDLIPRRACFTYHDRAAVPPRIVEAIAAACNDIPFHIFDDAEALQYLVAHFGASFANQFLAFPTGAHKADLFRYAWLYREGGVYFDIKTKFTQGVDKMFPWRTQRAMCTVLSAIPGTIYQGVLASYAHNPHLEEALRHVEDTSVEDVDRHYLLFTQQLHDILAIAATTGALVPGWNTLRDGPVTKTPVGTTTALLLYVEQCHASCVHRDRYGLCCSVVDRDGAHVCDVRHADFPWRPRPAA